MPSNSAAAVRSCAPLGDRCALSQTTYRQIDYHARRLGRMFRLPPEDVEDLSQEFVLHALRALRKHDSAKAKRTTLAKHAIIKHALHVTRTLSRSSRLKTLLKRPDAARVMSRRREQSWATATVGLDREKMLRIIDDMPSSQATLVSELGRMSCAAIAQQEGVHRGTVLRRVQALAPYFADRMQKP